MKKKWLLGIVVIVLLLILCWKLVGIQKTPEEIFNALDKLGTSDAAETPDTQEPTEENSNTTEDLETSGALSDDTEDSGETQQYIASEPENEIPVDYDDEFLEDLKTEYQSPVLLVGDAKAKPGDEVTVLVLALNNPGILGMSATLSYDESAMTLVSAQNGRALSDVLDLTASGTLKNGCRFLWDGLDIADDQVKDGEVLQLAFKINDNAKGGKYPVTLILDEGGTVDRELEQLDLTVDCGYVTVD